MHFAMMTLLIESSMDGMGTGSALGVFTSKEKAEASLYVPPQYVQTRTVMMAVEGTTAFVREGPFRGFYPVDVNVDAFAKDVKAHEERVRSAARAKLSSEEALLLDVK